MHRLRTSYVARCFLLGGLLWLGVAGVERSGLLGDDDARVVIVSDADMQQARALVAAKTGRPPTPRPLEMALQQRIDDHILVAEALRRGHHRRDPIVRRRLVENMALIYGDAAPRPAQLLREAEALGMPGQDLLVRRRLIELMQREFAGGHRVPDDAVLAAFVADHPQRFARQQQVSLEHRYFAAEPGEVRVQEALRRLQDGRAVNSDPYLHGERFDQVYLRDLQRLFGTAFAASIEAAPLGDWHGPVRSAHGWHLLRVAMRTPAKAPALEEVRRRAVYAWNEAQREQRIEQGMTELRKEYRVVMDVAPMRLSARPGDR